MKPALDYLSTFLHLIGMLLFAGGHIWFGVCTATAERHQRRMDEQVLAAYLPILANGFGVGVLLLFGSGLLKLLLWGEPGLIFLPDLYGWILLSKLLLYMIIVANGIVIERRYLPVVQTVGGEMTAAWTQVKIRARLNLVLILIVVALGETLRFSRL
jgi:hypothetical protein